MNATISVLLGTGLVIGVISFTIGIYFLVMRMRGIKALADLPGVGEISTLQAGISMLSVGGYCFWHAALTYAPIVHGAELQSKFNKVLVSTSQQLREEYRRAVSEPRSGSDTERFGRVTLLIDILNHLDNGNGHALYFAGEVKRAQGKALEAHKDFYRYFEVMVASQLPEDQGETGSEYCYTLPRGFCRQRSGWIRHLLADDFYRQGHAAVDVQGRLSHLETALKHAEAALRDYTGGFDGLKQGLPTRLIAKNAAEDITRLQQK